MTLYSLSFHFHKVRKIFPRTFLSILALFLLQVFFAPFVYGQPSQGLQKKRPVAPFVLSQAKAVQSLEVGKFGSSPVFEDAFGKNWAEKQTAWRIATWRQNGTMMSPERCRVNEEGRLVLTVLAGTPFQGGSLQTSREFGYGRWVARVKPSSVPGVLNSIFTKDWDDLTTPNVEADGKHAEVDIEFLTYTFRPGAGQVHLAIHLKGHEPLWEVDIPLDFNPCDAFHDWGFDILPDRIVWHVDGKELYTWLYTPEYIVDTNYEFFFNAWSMKKWIKGPALQSADYQIEWVKFYSHTPSIPSSKK